MKIWRIDIITLLLAGVGLVQLGSHLINHGVTRMNIKYRKGAFFVDAAIILVTVFLIVIASFYSN